MGSILRNTEGISKFEMPREGVIVVTFDDSKTTAAKIVRALEAGNFTVKGKPVYVKPGEPLPPGVSPGKSEPLPQKSSPGPGSPLPLYSTSPNAADMPPR